MLTRIMRLSMAAAVCATMAMAQGSEREEYGVAVPVTLSGGAFYNHRLQVRERARHPEAAAFRAMLYPTVKAGRSLVWIRRAAGPLDTLFLLRRVHSGAGAGSRAGPGLYRLRCTQGQDHDGDQSRTARLGIRLVPLAL